MAQYVSFFDAHPEYAPDWWRDWKNDSATPPAARVAKVNKVLCPFPETLAALADLAATDAREQKIEVPREWADGLARLTLSEPPFDWPPSRWPALITDAQAFLERWAGQAHRLGWQTWELFGCHRRKPWGAIHGMGLVPMLRGGEIIALTTIEAVVRTAGGARQSYRRRPHDPLHPSERGLLWELD
jgi:hypothetical protein